MPRAQRKPVGMVRAIPELNVSNLEVKELEHVLRDLVYAVYVSFQHKLSQNI